MPSSGASPAAARIKSNRPALNRAGREFTIEFNLGSNRLSKQATGHFYKPLPGEAHP